MRNIIRTLIMVWFTIFGSYAQAQTTQIIDLSTGISPNGTTVLLPLGANDDTWEVGYGGLTPVIPATFIPAICGSVGTFPNVRRVDPGSIGVGYYYYRTTFFIDCVPTGGTINLASICADDVIQEIRVNSTPHIVNYSFNGSTWGSCVTNDVINILPGEFVAGWNTILIRVKNDVGYTGMEIDGNLTITTTLNAGFTLTNNGSGVQATPTVLVGSHTWKVYASNTGNAGTYIYVGTYNTSTINFPATAPCYLIKHLVDTSCCVTQTVCNLPCVNLCSLTKPVNLQEASTNGTVHQLSWDPVPSATSYEVEIIWNDPECCPQGQGGPYTQVFTVHTPGYTLLNEAKRCFSWRVKAICESEYTISDKKCIKKQGQCSLLKPTNLSFSGSMALGNFSWTHPASLNIISQTLTTTWNDPTCCPPDAQMGPVSTSTYPLSVAATSYNLPNMIAPCFSWKVTIVCADGSTEIETKCGHVGASSGNRPSGTETFNSGQTRLQVFPNPAKDKVSLNVIAAKNMEFTIIVTDIHGQNVKTFDKIIAGEEQTTIEWNVSMLSKGIYFIKLITADKQTVSQKLVIR